jgi:aminoglycoside phosphotransferase (APT) family kinase protein
MSITPGPLVGRGRTAEIFAWENGWVLKLFHDWVSEGAAQREYRLAHHAHTAGANTPAVKDFVRHAGRWGFVMERVEGLTMLTALTSQPWRLVELAHMLADEQAQMHQCAAPGWPAQRERLEAAIRRASADYAEARDAVLRALAALPDGDRLCHGDFHPDNVLLTARGPVIIDWIDSVRGHPLADVARTSLLARLGDPPPGVKGRWLIRLGRGLFHALYLRRYFRRNPEAARQHLAAWELPVAAARIAEGIEPEQPQLLAILRRALPDIPLPVAIPG